MGAILFTISSGGKSLFFRARTIQELIDFNLKGKTENVACYVNKIYSDKLKDLLKSLVKGDPAYRPSA